MEDGETKSWSEGERTECEGERDSEIEMRHGERDSRRHVSGRRENKLKIIFL